MYFSKTKLVSKNFQKLNKYHVYLYGTKLLVGKCSFARKKNRETTHEFKFYVTVKTVLTITHP